MLCEVVLSSTSAASPLPLTSVHSLETGQLFHSFKSPPPPSTTTTTTTTNGKGKEVDESEYAGQTMSFVEGSNGVGRCVVGLGGKLGRAVVHVWNFSRDATVQRLVPPVRLTTVSVSPDGEYLVGGTPDGRVFVWQFGSGLLVATLDAHYRAVTALAWTRDASCLVTASDDAGCSVWSIGHVLASTPLRPATPFATLSDHTLGVTDVVVGLGTFPRCRVFTASKDATVKVWDLATTPATLLTTFEFPARVQHLVVDPLERFLFVSVPTSSGGSKVIRVNLYAQSSDGRTKTVTAVGGTRGAAGKLERISVDAANDVPGETYTLAEPVSALHLSRHSPTLLVATAATSQVHALALASLLPTRVISPPPSSTPYGGLAFLTTFLYEPGGSRAGVEREIATTLGRTVVGVDERERGGKNGTTVAQRIHEADPVEDLIGPVAGLPSMFTSGGGDSAGAHGATAAHNGGGAGRDRETIERLEKELEGYRKGLDKANRVNERIWKSVVEATLQ
ncbi:hypothetical protein JCM11491_001276 [Sporobolomyces phaffii]